MTLARALYHLHMARSTWLAAGGGRHVPEMRSPRIVRDGWMACIVVAEWTVGNAN